MGVPPPERDGVLKKIKEIITLERDENDCCAACLALVGSQVPEREELTGASTDGKPWIGVETDSHAQSAASSSQRFRREGSAENMPIGGLPVPGPS